MAVSNGQRAVTVTIQKLPPKTTMKTEKEIYEIACERVRKIKEVCKQAGLQLSEFETDALRQEGIEALRFEEKRLEKVVAA